ncbi:hypothetical protein ACTXPD_17425 [Vreelandella alkaliphila]|uniref:hypothetical protein n=1 Tax=Halomonadaceae TaxID=28256 RepID=UPI0018667D42|nr:hypothetical protein [Halomonas sp. FME65]
MDNQVTKRPRVLTLCMLAATVSTLALAGCGSDEEPMPPAEQPETMEQDATSSTEQATTASDATASDTTSDPMMNDEPAASDDSAMGDPGLSDEAAASQEPMPNEEASNPDDPEETPGFGEGTDPMPSADENDDEMNSGQ